MYAKINLKNLFCNLKYLSLYKRYREKYIVCMFMHKKSIAGYSAICSYLINI